MPSSQPRWAPTPEQIRLIETMSGLGLTTDDMAALIDISKTTFERGVKRYSAMREALSKGRAKANAKLTETAFKMATNGKNPAMTIFLCKVRLRWKEPKDVIEVHSGEANANDGKPKIVITLPDNGRSAK